MLDAKQSLDAIDRTRQDGLNILHSYIDRDPIDIDEELQKYDVCESSISTCNNLQDVFAPQHQQWRSPLERGWYDYSNVGGGYYSLGREDYLNVRGGYDSLVREGGYDSFRGGGYCNSLIGGGWYDYSNVGE
jgi:hypothetical protein